MSLYGCYWLEAERCRGMKSVFGLVLMLLALCYGLESDCDGKQDRAQCYGALGGTVNLQLLNRASDVFDFHGEKNKSVILRVRKGKIVENLIESRSSFTGSNGTFRIINLSRTDEGEYIFIEFNSDGEQLLPRTLQLTIEAPVSSVSLVTECLSQGQTRASCSSEGGDSPQYSWTLGGRPLRNDQLLSGNTESENITLREKGELVCTVRNHVSSVERSEEISTCGFTFTSCTLSNGTYISLWEPEANKTLCIEPTTIATEGKETSIVSLTPSTNTSTPAVNKTGTSWDTQKLMIVGGVLAMLIILLVVGVVAVCLHKKKNKNVKKDEEGEQDVTYADVRILQQQQQQGRPVQPKSEVEVEYGQIKFSKRAGPRAEAGGDDTVYAQVRRGR